MLKENLPSLTGIRALAAIWVVSLHFHDSWALLFPPLAFIRPLIAAGNYGVDLFFLLSGLIMMHVYAAARPFRWRDYRFFIGKRLARIYPAYLVAFLFMVALVLAATLAGIPVSAQMYPPSSLLREALMLQAWGPLVPSWNYPAWSISAEWFAYLAIFPLALLLYHRLDDIAPPRRVLAAALLAPAFLVLLVLSPHPDGLPHALIRVSCEFLAGALLYHLLRALHGHPRLADVLVISGFLLLVLTCWRPPDGRLAGFLLLAALALLITGFGEPRSLSARLLSASPWVYLGTVSYSLYLVHAPVQRVLKIILPAERFTDASPALRYAVLAAHLLALLLAAAALFHLVEDPARRCLVRKLSSRRKSEKILPIF